MRFAAKVDTTHSAVVDAFRNCGAKVRDTSRVGQGFPDLIVNWRGRIVLVEVKGPKGKLRTSQVVFARDWPVVVIRSAAEAYAFCGVAHVEDVR